MSLHWSAKLTVDELARQHFDLARTFTAVP
jgi:hypothetical protein